jgi:hypothetical protein
LKMLLIQAADLERSPTREEIEVELLRPKGASKRSAGSSPMSAIYGGGSQSSSRGYEVASATDVDRRLGGLEESMKLVLQLLGAPGVKLLVPSDGAAKKPTTEMSARSEEAKIEVGVMAEHTCKFTTTLRLLQSSITVSIRSSSMLD